MIAAELRGGNKPSLNEALGWIGSRVDDIYGASVGRLEDVWIDPGTGVPRWLLVKEGRFGGRTTLIPFEDATAGAGHVWVPYEREIVRDAPEIEPGAPLTQQVEAALRSHYAANVPAAISHGTQQAEEPSGPSTPAPATATIRFATGGAEKEEPVPPEPEVPRRAVLREQPPLSRVRGVIPPLPPRPAPPTPVPTSQPYSAYPPQPEPQPPQQQRPGWQMPMQPPAPQPQYHQQFQPPPPQQYQPPPPPPLQYQPPTQWQQPQPQAQPPQGPPPPPPSQPQQQPLPADPFEALASLGRSSQSHYVEIELSGELSIRGELRSVRVIPRDPNA